MKHYKKAFSLIELIFIIAVLAVISSIAIPKFMEINSKAKVSSLKQDISTIISSTQSYYLVNNKIDKISDAVNLNSSVWNITDTQIKYENCITINLNTSDIRLVIDSNASTLCNELANEGISNETYNFN